MVTKRQVVVMTFAFSMLMLISARVQADPVTFTLTNPNQTGAPGSVLTFAGTVNNGGPPAITITSNNFQFNAPASLMFDDGLFVINFLGQTVASNGSLGPLSSFVVWIGNATPPGTYNGLLSVVYSSTVGTGLESNVQAFSVTVQPAGVVIPEPTTALLLASGLVSLLGLRQVRRR